MIDGHSSSDTFPQYLPKILILVERIGTFFIPYPHLQDIPWEMKEWGRICYAKGHFDAQKMCRR